MSGLRSTLVTGASSSLCRRVIKSLLEHGGTRVIAGTRFPQLCAPLADRGIEVRYFNYDEQLALEHAMEGVDQVLLVSPLRFESVPRHAQQLKLAIIAASRKGVERVVFTSSSHPDPDSPMLLAPSHRSAEWELMRSGMTWTSLRLNFPTDYLWELVVCQAWTGALVAAAGDGGAAFVTEEDAACSAAALFVSDGRGGEMLEVTGPRMETFADIADAVTEFTSQRMAYLRATPSAAREHLISSVGLSEQAADLIVSCQLAIREGKYGPPSTVVRNLTGRNPISVREYIQARRRAWVEDRQALGLPQEGSHKP